MQSLPGSLLGFWSPSSQSLLDGRENISLIYDSDKIMLLWLLKIKIFQVHPWQSDVCWQVLPPHNQAARRGDTGEVTQVTKVTKVR